MRHDPGRQFVEQYVVHGAWQQQQRQLKLQQQLGAKEQACGTQPHVAPGEQQMTSMANGPVVGG